MYLINNTDYMWIATNVGLSGYWGGFGRMSKISTRKEEMGKWILYIERKQLQSIYNRNPVNPNKLLNRY